MGPLLNIFYPWGIILQGLAIFHFIRRRPDTYWLWIILFGGGLGAAVYIVAEVLPDTGLLRQSFKVFPRRRRIHELEAAIIIILSYLALKIWLSMLGSVARHVAQGSQGGAADTI